MRLVKALRNRFENVKAFLVEKGPTPSVSMPELPNELPALAGRLSRMHGMAKGAATPESPATRRL